MKITVRLSTETAYNVTVPDNLSVQDLRNSVKVACPVENKLPADFKLIYNGVKLDPFYKSLAEFGLSPAASDPQVILMNSGDASPLALPVITATTVRKSGGKKKAKCLFQLCHLAPLRMVGECQHCNGKFCAKHRLLEDHHCQDLQTCRDTAHEKNAMKLNNESTIANRV